jgi:DNA-binding beta-propeller fold protein YncE
MLTFEVKPADGGRRTGVVHRYEIPGFRRLATYHLPGAVVYAAADEVGGRLVTLAASTSDIYWIGNGATRAVTPAELHVFDLGRLTDGSLADNADVKPIIIKTLGSRSWVTGLALAPDGKTAFVSSIVRLPPGAPNTPGRPGRWTGKIQQFNPATGAVGLEFNPSFPMWQILLSPDGQQLYAADHSLRVPEIGPFELGFGSGVRTSVWVVDPVRMKLSGSVSLPDSPSDLAMDASGRVVAVVPYATGRSRVMVVAPKPSTVDLEASPSPGPGLQQAFNAALTPDGQSLILGSINDGVGVYSIENLRPGGLLRYARAAKYGDQKIYGQMHVTPDGRYVAFHSGHVLALQEFGPRSGP